MPARLKTSFLFLALVAQGLATALGQDGNATVQPSKIAKESRGTYRGAPVVHATFVENGPKIDGDLNDEVWQRALPAGGELFQVEHKDNVTGSEVTEFRVLYDKNNLYLGVWCFQKNPNEITANAGNDENSDGDDFVGVILDTFHDKRNGYIFLVTPNSLRVDVLVSDNKTSTVTGKRFGAQGAPSATGAGAPKWRFPSSPFRSTTRPQPGA